MWQNGLDEAVRKADDFGSREAVFGWQPTEWPQLRDVLQEFTPHYSLWIIAADFEVNKNDWLKVRPLHHMGVTPTL